MRILCWYCELSTCTKGTVVCASQIYFSRWIRGNASYQTRLSTFTVFCNPFTGSALVEQWLPTANACERSPQPLSALSIAQQCGGSDAFSGVSGNPCAGEACMLLIKQVSNCSSVFFFVIMSCVPQCA